MPRILYTVAAHLPSPELSEAYAAWLRGGHVQAVLAAGALSATIAALDPTPGQRARTVEVRYIFPSRAAFDAYVEHVAPELRAAGQEQFGPRSGTVFTRSVGEVVEHVEG